MSQVSLDKTSFPIESKGAYTLSSAESDSLAVHRQMTNQSEWDSNGMGLVG